MVVAVMQRLLQEVREERPFHVKCLRYWGMMMKHGGMDFHRPVSN
jgi:hypothetical protein